MPTPKEKAESLCRLYYNRLEHTLSEDYSKYDSLIAIECALSTVNEIEAALLEYDTRNGTDELQNMDRDFNFWDKVEEELLILKEKHKTK